MHQFLISIFRRIVTLFYKSNTYSTDLCRRRLPARTQLDRYTFRWRDHRLPVPDWLLPGRRTVRDKAVNQSDLRRRDLHKTPLTRVKKVTPSAAVMSTIIIIIFGQTLSDLFTCFCFHKYCIHTNRQVRYIWVDNQIQIT